MTNRETDELADRVGAFVRELEDSVGPEAASLMHSALFGCAVGGMRRHGVRSELVAEMATLALLAVDRELEAEARRVLS